MSTPSFRKLTVLHVLAPAREGGLESVVEMLVSGQGSRAHVAAVLTPGDAQGHPFVARLRDGGLAVTPVVVGGRAYLSEYRALRALIVDIRADVVHTHGYRADVIGGIAARRAGVPAVSTVHGFLGGGSRNRLNEALQCHALRRASAVIAVSRPLVARLQSAGVKSAKIHMLPNAYLAPGDLMSRADARAALGIAPDARVVGWVGRLSSEKGPDVMLHALAATPEPWRLSMVGTGRDGEALLRAADSLGIAQRITWHGSVARVASQLPAFDAFALSSRTEGTPIALLEAMAAGVPIVATRVGGVPDVVRETEAIVVPAEDPAAIAAALAEIARAPDAAASRRDSARARVATVFGAAAWLQQVDAIYERVSARTHARTN